MKDNLYVLLVDDNPKVLSVADSVMSRFGFRSDLAGSGERALEMYRELDRDYAAVVSDYSMGGMSGLDLVERLREFDSFVPMFILTGDPSLVCSVRAREYGVVVYGKPDGLFKIPHMILPHNGGGVNGFL